jgi:hypothetical protein
MEESQVPTGPQDYDLTDGTTATGLMTDDTQDKEMASVPSDWNWKQDSYNPNNWPKWRKNMQLLTIASIGFAWYYHPMSLGIQIDH